MLRRSFYFVVSIVLGVLILPSAGLAQSERITSFNSAITVNTDATVDVTETIAVVSANQEIRHGIYRDFPTRYKDQMGNNYVVGFDVLSVTRDGSRENYFFENQENGVRIYLGDKETFVSPGAHTYIISYRTNRQVGFFKDHDEIYWNVTGNGWSFAIEAASATVRLPQGISTADIRATAFTGEQGSTERNVTASVEFGGAYLKTTRQLWPHQGLTIAVSFPKGFVHEPTAQEKLQYFIYDNRAVLVGLAVLLGLLLYYSVMWAQYGKDPRRGTIIPLFTPPEGLSPAAVRYILNKGYDTKVFTAAIINMAVKGFYKINNDHAKYSLSKVKAPQGAELSPEEKVIAAKIYSSPLIFENTHHTEVAGAISGIKASLSRTYEKKYFVLNTELFIPGVIVSLAAGVWLFFQTLSGPVLLIIGAMILLDILFRFLLIAPTLAGRKVMDQIEGFKMYLSTAEKDRLNVLNPPEKTPELFEKYLPYALALDVEQQWSEQFSEVLRKLAETQPQVYGPGYWPRWYSGTNWNPSRVGQFSSALGSTFSGVIAASAVPPSSSSGFSGGGFSGGGGGGGGGGGW